MAEATYLPSGTVLAGRYEIAGELGRGGYSVVYRARDRRIDAEVAIKLLVPPPAAARLARERLRREVQAVRELSHPNVVGVYDVVDDGPWSFVVMEYVAGPDLAVRVRDRGPLAIEAAARLGRDVAAALEAAHRRGILHRDVKPQNILLGPDGCARLTDFGAARLAGQVTVTQTGGLVGTLAYAAPEVVAGGRGDARADVYGLGLTLYFVLTGELPTRTAASRAEGYRPSERRAEVPDWIDEAVAQATAWDPDDRFLSVALFAGALTSERASDGAAVLRPRRGICAICQAVEPFGLGVCPRCARRASADRDVLVFLERTTSGPARSAVEEALADRIGSTTSAAQREALARAERPLFRVPTAAGLLAVSLLEDLGLPARTAPVGPVWRAAVPTPIAVLSALVAAGGFAAGMAAVAPALLISAPLVAITLVGVAAVARRTPVWDPLPRSRTAEGLPRDAERALVGALAELRPGVARRLLIDLAQRAGAVPAGAASIGPLVVAASAAARELAGLERHLAAFDAERETLADPPAAWFDALARCEQGRDALVLRLLDAGAALSRATGDAALRTAAATDPLAELTRGLDEESRLQAEAAREVEGLLTSH